eukprot:4294011-Amphidinium_carterae.1
MHLAKWNNAALRAKVKASGGRDVDETVFQQALAEVEKGWLLGPWNSVAEAEESLGCRIVFSR